MCLLCNAKHIAVLTTQMGIMDDNVTDSGGMTFCRASAYTVSKSLDKLALFENGKHTAKS